jgi:uncharacterized protein (TIGR02265 family)
MTPRFRRAPPVRYDDRAMPPPANATDFQDPPWDAPLDTEEALRRMPPSATISGMFLNALVLDAEKRGYHLPSAGDRYVPFRFYPLEEHGRLLLETCHARFSDMPVRQALRKLGRGAPQALLSSTLGKVVLGSVEGVHAIVRAMVSAYPLNTKPCDVSVLEHADEYMIVRLDQIHYFLDSHHVGTFEGVLRFAGVSGKVRIRSYTPTRADFLLEWKGR